MHHKWEAREQRNTSATGSLTVRYSRRRSFDQVIGEVWRRLHGWSRPLRHRALRGPFDDAAAAVVGVREWLVRARRIQPDCECVGSPVLDGLLNCVNAEVTAASWMDLVERWIITLGMRGIVNHVNDLRSYLWNMAWMHGRGCNRGSSQIISIPTTRCGITPEKSSTVPLA